MALWYGGQKILSAALEWSITGRNRFYVIKHVQARSQFATTSRRLAAILHRPNDIERSIIRTSDRRRCASKVIYSFCSRQALAALPILLICAPFRPPAHLVHTTGLRIGHSHHHENHLKRHDVATVKHLD